jgi:hypothetical protein
MLWDGELDYGELADDIAVEARLALQLTDEVKISMSGSACCWPSWIVPAS